MWSQRFLKPLVLMLLLPNLSGIPLASAQSEPVTFVPSHLSEDKTQRTILPAWEAITFANLPPLSQGGAWTHPVTKITRRWDAGQSLGSVMTLADFASSFHLQHLNLYFITTTVGLQPQQLTLADFPLFEQQTLADLAQAIPRLQQTPVADIAPIAQLLKTTKGESPLLKTTLGTLLATDSQLGTLSFANVDLSQYPLTAIPKLMNTPLQNFRGWEQVLIEEVPGLSQLPWSRFPTPPRNQGAMGTLTWQASPDNPVETSFAIQANCTGCPETPLASPQLLPGQRPLVPGEVREVRTGNGDLEPGGYFPHGEAFKVAVTQVDTTAQTISVGMYFRFAQSPYVVGSVPLAVYENGDRLLLGSTVTHPVTHLQTPTPTSELEPLNLPALQNAYHQGLQLRAYESVSPFVENSTGQGGRKLGRYGYWSGSKAVQSLIATKEGGEDFLNRLATGEAVSHAEVLRYFPPMDQDYLFATAQLNLLHQATRQIDPYSHQPFTQERLIERMAQMYLGGELASGDDPQLQPLASRVARAYQNTVTLTAQANESEISFPPRDPRRWHSRQSDGDE